MCGQADLREDETDPEDRDAFFPRLKRVERCHLTEAEDGEEGDEDERVYQSTHF